MPQRVLPVGRPEHRRYRRTRGGRPGRARGANGATSSSARETRSAFDILMSVRTVRFSVPASTRWMYRAETSARSASCSWVNSCATRSSATRRPIRPSTRSGLVGRTHEEVPLRARVDHGPYVRVTTRRTRIHSRWSLLQRSSWVAHQGHERGVPRVLAGRCTMRSQRRCSRTATAGRSAQSFHPLTKEEKQ
jgi:hypothetical protein